MINLKKLEICMDFLIKDAPLQNDGLEVASLYCEHCGTDTNHVEISPNSGCFECVQCCPDSYLIRRDLKPISASR